jgi:hypothetical protein
LEEEAMEVETKEILMLKLQIIVLVNLLRFVLVENQAEFQDIENPL